MAVIAPAGVVGRVVVPSGRAAKVQLLIDRNAAAGAIVERSRAQGVVVGGGDERLQHGVRVGGRRTSWSATSVVTSGIDGDLSERLRHRPGRGGREERRRRTSAIIVRPAVDFSRARGGAGRADADAGARQPRRRAGVKAAGVILAVAAALALQTTLGRFVVRGRVAVDLVLVVVVYVALTSGPVTGPAGRDVGRPGAGRAVERRASASAGWRRRWSGFWPASSARSSSWRSRCRGSSCFSRPRCCTRSSSWGCTCCWICVSSVRRMRRSPARRSATPWSASWRSSWSSFCRERSSGGGRRRRRRIRR